MEQHPHQTGEIEGNSIVIFVISLIGALDQADTTSALENGEEVMAGALAVGLEGDCNVLVFFEDVEEDIDRVLDVRERFHIQPDCSWGSFNDFEHVLKTISFSHIETELSEFD